MPVMFLPSYFSEDDRRRFVIRERSHSQAGGERRRRLSPSGASGLGASNLDQSEEDQESRRLGKTDERGGGRKEMSPLLGGVSATTWSQVERLRGRGAGSEDLLN